MPNQKDYPYVTRTNVYYKPLEIVDEKALSDACRYKWYAQTLCQVNDSVVRLGVFQGEFHWHKHKNEDEFFYVVAGKLSLDLKGKTIEVAPRQGIVVPKGMLHRPRSAKRSVVLMVETASVVPTGD